jgi:hypothetical protein
MAVKVETGSKTQDPEIPNWLRWKRVNLDSSIPTISSVGEEAESFLFEWWKLRTQFQLGEIEIAQLQEKGGQLLDSYGKMNEKVERAMNVITKSTRRQKLV